jgi:hypothetical protein
LPGNVTARDQLADCAIGFAAGALRVLCGPVPPAVSGTPD